MRRPRKTCALALGLWLTAIGPSVLAQAPSSPNADELASRSLEAFYYAGKDFRAKVEMKLIDAGGQQRERSLTMLRKNSGGPGVLQRYFLYFHTPQDVRRTAFLVWKYPDRDDDRWLYLPAIDLVRRIAASDRHSSFVGSDFTYEDISGRDLAADSRKYLREEKLGDSVCDVIEATPKEEAQYGRKVSWLDRRTSLPRKEEYYDRRGELYKVFTADAVEDVGGIPTATARTMKDVRSSHVTTVRMTGVEYNLGLEEDVFTERFLRRPPQRWLK